MDCRFVHRHLNSYFEQLLSSDEKKLLEDHVCTCGECDLIVRNFNVFKAFIAVKKQDKPGPFVETRTLQRLEAEVERMQRAPKFSPWVRLQPVIVSLMLLLAVSAGLLVAKHMEAVLSTPDQHTQNVATAKEGLSLHDFIDETAYQVNK